MFIRFISLLLITFVVNTTVFAQNTNTQEEATLFGNIAFGYYNPMAAGGTGNILYTDVGLKLESNFIIGFGFGMSDVFEEYDEVPMLNGVRTYHNYYNYKLSISKRLHIGNKRKQILTFGTGFVYNQVKYSEPYIYLQHVGGDDYTLEVGVNRSDNMQNEFGSILSFNYAYKLHKIEIGFKAEGHLLFDIGLGGLILAPQISFAF